LKELEKALKTAKDDLEEARKEMLEKDKGKSDTVAAQKRLSVAEEELVTVKEEAKKTATNQNDKLEEFNEIQESYKQADKQKCFARKKVDTAENEVSALFARCSRYHPSVLFPASTPPARLGSNCLLSKPSTHPKACSLPPALTLPPPPSWPPSRRARAPRAFGGAPVMLCASPCWLPRRMVSSRAT